jgi:ABC-type multidrug transport system permease subunit
VKALAVAIKTLREAVREPQIALLFVFFPAMLVAIYYSSFSQGGVSMASLLKLIVIDRDRGPAGAELVRTLYREEFDGKSAYSIIEGLSVEQALIRLEEGKSSLLLLIPEDFSERLRDKSMWPASVSIRCEPRSDIAAMARSFLTGTLRRFGSAITGEGDIIPASYELLPGTGTANDFNVSIPGVVVFGILFGILTSALMLTRETERNTLMRLSLSGVRSSTYFAGFTAAQLVLSLVQITVTYAAAMAFAFKSAGPLLHALPFLFLTSLCATGFGIITAAFARTDSGAMSLAMLFLAPLAFLSGAVFPIKEAALFEAGGATFGLTHLLPSRHAGIALSNILVYGTGINGSLYELCALAVETAAVMVTAFWLYGKRRFRG